MVSKGGLKTAASAMIRITTSTTKGKRVEIVEIQEGSILIGWTDVTFSTMEPQTPQGHGSLYGMQPLSNPGNARAQGKKRECME